MTNDAHAHPIPAANTMPPKIIITIRALALYHSHTRHRLVVSIIDRLARLNKERTHSRSSGKREPRPPDPPWLEGSVVRADDDPTSKQRVGGRIEIDETLT